MYRSYEAFILIEPVETDGMLRVRERLLAENRPFLIVDHTTELKPETFRQFFKQSGVWVYCDTDDVVYANQNWLCIHASFSGQKHIRLPRPMRLVPQFGEGEAFVSDHFSLFLPKCATRLFRLEEEK